MKMLTWKTLAGVWAQPTREPASMRIAVMAVYGWFLFHACMMWGESDLVWGEQTVLMRYGAPSGKMENAAYALMYDLSLFPWVWWTHLAAAFLSMLDRSWSWLPRIALWTSGWLLYYAGYAALNSGILLMLLLAFYLIPYFSRSTQPERIVLNNAARTATQIQVVMVYALSFFWKVIGSQWPEGTALYYTLNIAHYSPQGWAEEGVPQSGILIALTWLALLYQGAFPILVWWKKTRTWMIPAGILFHLTIGWAMHLWDFAMAMIAAYTVFRTDSRS
jgi:hypothetical protein